MCIRDRKMDRAAYWLGTGAQASDGVVRILRRANLVDEKGNAVPYTPAAESVA